MATFEFYSVSTARETYVVEADTEEQARAIVEAGDAECKVSEVDGIDIVYSRELVDEHER